MIIVKDATVAKDIRLLAAQLEKAYEDNDFKEWLSTTLVLAKRIFSEQDDLVKPLQQIQTQGLNESYARMGSRAILHALIDTLRYTGHACPPQHDPTSVVEENSPVIKALKAQLTPEQWQRVEATTSSSADDEVKNEQLIQQLSHFGSPLLAQVIAQLITQQQ